MKTNATFFQNNPDKPLVYGEVELINPPRQRLRGEPLKEGKLAVPVFCGFCGTDYEFLRMSERGEISTKFPEGQNRLINGHEGVVWVPDEKRFAIVLIRGGDSFDPTRYTEDEMYFEYGCDKADGIFCDKGYFNPDMLLHLPKPYDNVDKLPLSLAKKLVFADPYSCAVFQHERLCDLGMAQNFRVEKAHRRCNDADAMTYAYESTFDRVVIFGLGTTGLFIGDQIRMHHNNAKILFVARSDENSNKAEFAKNELKADYLCNKGLSEEETASAVIAGLGGRATVFVGTSGNDIESRIAFKQGVLGCNGIYDSFSLGPKVSFDSMPFGFENHLIFGSINFTQKHMETAIRILCASRFDTLTELIDKDEFISDPIKAYKETIYAPGAPLKTAVVWNEDYIDFEK